MKKLILISSTALLILGLLAIGRNRKDQKKILTDTTNELHQTHSALRLLHHAKKSAIKNLHSKN